ncbi:MAG: FecR domain-containing protein [Planctomycetes bacterium]|nr:FecR domain-containing protein [Planctomycetota bacterium]
MDDRQCIRISELLLLIYDGSAGPGDVAEMEAMVSGNQEALEYYVKASMMELNYFHYLAQVPLSNAEDTATISPKDFKRGINSEQQWDLLKDLAEHEKIAPTIEVEKPEEDIERQLIQKVEYQRPVRTINHFSLAIVAFSVAALFLMILYVRLAPPAPYEVATVTDSINARWSSALPIEPGIRLLSNSAPIQLTCGSVEFVTDNQVQVVLEAPAEFYFASDAEISMDYGRLFAHVSEQGAGFSVVTPNSKVIDLGTEFGVLAHLDGNTEVHLYKGKAQLLAGQKDGPQTSQTLKAGSARIIDSKTYEIQEIALDDRSMARTITVESTSLVNGGFEAGDTTGWTVNLIGAGSTMFSSTESPLSGSYSTKFVTDWQGGIGVKSEIIQTVTGLSGGTSYDFELWVKGLMDTGGVAWAEIKWFSASRAQVGGTGLIKLEEDLSDTVYEARGGTYTTPDGTTSAEISIRLEGGAMPAVNTLYVDEISFK